MRVWGRWPPPLGSLKPEIHQRRAGKGTGSRYGLLSSNDHSWSESQTTKPPRLDDDDHEDDTKVIMAWPTPVGKGDTQAPQLIVSATLLWVLAASLVALRCYVRTKIVRAFGSEDWTLLAALVSPGNAWGLNW